MEIQQLANYQGYDILGLLGKGTFGKVKLAKKDQKLVAIKFLSNKLTSKTYNINKDLLLKQIEILQTIRHPNLVTYIDSNVSGIYTRKNGKQYERLGLIIEYLPSYQLFEILQYGPLGQDLSRTYFQQLINGLDSLHRNSIIHRDLKPQNILFDKELKLKITDFGLSKIVQNNAPVTICGTSGYKSPEMMLNLKYNGILNDLFSAGVILFNMVTGRSPFDSAHPKTGMYKYIATNQHAKFWAEFDKKIKLSDQLKSMLNCMLAFDPTHRLTIADIKSHPWYTADTLMGEQLERQLRSRIQSITDKKNKEKMAKKLANRENNCTNKIIFGQKAFRDIQISTKIVEQQNEQQQIITSKPKTDKIQQQINKKIYNESITKTTDIFVDSIRKLNNFCNLLANACTEVRIVSEEHTKIYLKKVSENDAVVIELQIYQVNSKLDCLRFQKIQGSFEKHLDFMKEINDLFEE